MNTELTNIALKNDICSKADETIAGCTNEILFDLLDFYLKKKIWPIWMLGNSFTSRLASRLKSHLSAELLMMLEMTLPGTQIHYYGDELGMKDCCLNEDLVFNFKKIDKKKLFFFRFIVDEEIIPGLQDCQIF